MKTERINSWTTHWDSDGYWTGTRGAVFLALAQGGSFRGAGQRVIGHATTQRGADRIIGRYAKEAQRAGSET